MHIVSNPLDQYLLKYMEFIGCKKRRCLYWNIFIIILPNRYLKFLSLQILNLSIFPLNQIQRRILQFNLKTSMTIKLILILTTLTFALGFLPDSYEPDFSFNPNTCRINNFDSSWYILRCQCGPDIGYQFTNLPDGWYALNENVYIPKNKLQRRIVYPCKAAFIDKRLNRVKLQRSLLLQYDEYFQGIYDQSFDFDFYNDQPRISKILQRCGDGWRFYRDSRFYPQFAPIININNGFLPATPAFNVYPSDQQCQNIISEGNCGRIREILTSVTQHKDSCRKRADYLSIFQDKIQNRIDSYRTDAQNLRQNIFKLQAKLNQLKEKSQKYQYDDNNEINQRIRKYREQITRYGRERDQYQTQCKGTRESILKLRQQIQSIKLATANSRLAIQEQDQRCRVIDRNIAELQVRLANLRQDREQSRRKRQYHQRIIDDSLRKIQDCNFKIGNHERYLNDYDIKTKTWVTYIDDYNKKIEGCNRQIEGFKGKRGLFKSENVIKKISELEQEIAINQKQAEKLVSIYKKLEQYQDQFEDIISKHYFQCYNYLPPKNEKNKRGHYLIQGQAFQKYLKDTFGQAPNENIRARFTGIIDLKRFSPLSVSWTKVYDIPSTIGYGSNMDKAQNNYKCTQSENLKTVCAKIEEITKNVIKVVDQNGDRFQIQLGGCTRMELVSNKELPQVGQSIMCKGLLRGQKNLFAHHVTCY